MTTLLANAAEYLLEGKDPARVALRFTSGDYTYGELSAFARGVMRLLLEQGRRKGEVVPLIGDNSFFWAGSYLGILGAGLVCAPLSTATGPAELEDVLQQTEARVAFVQGQYGAKNRAALERLDVVTEADKRLSAKREDRGPMASDAAGEDDLAALMFTSGSTGRPRGVMITHRNIIANTDSIIDYLRLTEADRIMAVLPFHYCFGASLLHTHLRAGGTVVVDQRFLYPEVILQRMIECRCTGFAGVPSHFQILLRNSSLRKKSFPDLRYVQQAGGCLAPNFIQELRTALPNAEIFVMYGQTEATARLSYLPPCELDAKLGSIGRGIPGVRLDVLGEDGKPVRPGEVGEIVAWGANVAKGYWRDGAESAKTFSGGSLRTGDLATVDEDGFVFILDRAKDFLKCGGERVSCRILEEQLLAFEEVVEAAVVGVPDDVLGESVKAFIVPKGGCPDGVEERLLRFCRSRLSPTHMPKQIVTMRALPKNSSGKVLKSQLRGGGATAMERTG